MLTEDGLARMAEKGWAQQVTEHMAELHKTLSRTELAWMRRILASDPVLRTFYPEWDQPQEQLMKTTLHLEPQEISLPVSVMIGAERRPIGMLEIVIPRTDVELVSDDGPVGGA